MWITIIIHIENLVDNLVDNLDCDQMHIQQCPILLNVRYKTNWFTNWEGFRKLYQYGGSNMKKNIAIFAVAVAIGLSAIAPASAAMRLSVIESQNAEIIQVGSHSQGGYGGGYRFKKHYKRHYQRHYKPHYKPHYQPTKHTHYHCHYKKIHGYWENVCHVARHRIHGNHHSYKYH